MKGQAWIVRLVLATALGLAGPVAAQTLTVSAASSLADALRVIGARFEAQRPGVRLRLNVAASGVLLQQLKQGAPVDVLASADEQTLDSGVALGLLDASSRRDIAGNVLVLVAPPGTAQPARLADLRSGTLQRIAIGKPASVPAGRYAREALERAGLWSAVQPRLISGESVRQVLDYVARGEVDAGFVYRSDVAAAPLRVRLVEQLPLAQPIRYPVARASDSRQRALATAFIDFLLSAEAQSILAQHGFSPP